MGKLFTEQLDDWGQGVITSLEPDAIPPGAYAHGLNCALTSIGAQKAVVMKRKGCRTLNATQVTGASAIVGMHEFRMVSGSSLTSYRVLVSDNGRVDVVDTAGSLTAISASGFTSSTAQEFLPSFADAKNNCYILNGTDAKKFTGTALQNWGIVAPTTAPTLGDSGSAGLHNGTYEAYVTFVNSTTGYESSAGITSSTVTVASKQIAWTNVPVSSDAQVDKRNLYIRNTSTQSNFYLAGSISDNSSTTTTTNVSDTALTEIGPDEDENDPPPAGGKIACWHRSRMFVATETDLFYSKAEKPESFDPELFEPVNPDDSQVITGLFSAFDVLIIFKSRSMYALVGDDPDTWTIRQIDPQIGCVASRSVMSADGRVFWWSAQGPTQWTGSGQPTFIGTPFISTTLSPSNLSTDPAQLAKICASPDYDNQRVLWAVPNFGQARNTTILPFSYRVDRWESDGWDPLDVASMTIMTDAVGRQFVHLGGYAGQVFKLWDSTSDGVTSGTVAGTFVAAATSITTVTDLTASFLTIGGALTERKVTICDANGVKLGSLRPRITSNTGTSFTMNAAVNGLTVGQTYTYYIGGPAFDFSTAWLTSSSPFFKKRYMFLYPQLKPMSSSVGVRFDMYFSYDLTRYVTRTQTFMATTSTGTWDVSDWDAARWDPQGFVSKRFRLGSTGTSMQVRLRHYAPNADLVLLKLNIIAEALSEKIG